jgi:D-amino peptidase
MEGTAGVTSWNQVDARSHTREYVLYQRHMTAEVLAAVEGAKAGGATEFLINDSHGPMRNLLLDELPSDVRVIFGNRKPLSMVEGLASEHGGLFFTGYHGAIGDADATLCHTYTPSVVYGVRVNGFRCSEATINAGLAGSMGLPVLLITGDRTTVESAKAQMPWITGVIVKESIGHYGVNSMSPAAACDAIREGAQRAVRDAGQAKPLRFEPPITLEIDLARVEQADLVAGIPYFVRTGSRSVRFVHDDYATVFRAFVAAFRMGGTAE